MGDIEYYSHIVSVNSGKPLNWLAILNNLAGHSSHVDSVAFSPDGSQIMSGSWDNTIRLWDTGTGDGTESRSRDIPGLSIMLHFRQMDFDHLVGWLIRMLRSNSWFQHGSTLLDVNLFVHGMAWEGYRTV